MRLYLMFVTAVCVLFLTSKLAKKESKLRGSIISRDVMLPQVTQTVVLNLSLLKTISNEFLSEMS